MSKLIYYRIYFISLWSTIGSEISSHSLDQSHLKFYSIQSKGTLLFVAFFQEVELLANKISVKFVVGWAKANLLQESTELKKKVNKNRANERIYLGDGERSCANVAQTYLNQYKEAFLLTRKRSSSSV